MPVTASAAVVLAAGLDAAVGEPPARVHPVALLGGLVSWIDRSGDGDRDVGSHGADGDPTDGWSHPRLVGVLTALFVPLLFAAVAAAVVALGSTVAVELSSSVGLAVAPWFGAALAAGILFSATSLRLLLDSARTVIDESDADLDAARIDLRALAGRDADSLDAAHVRSAAVESLAENLADGLVAPLFAFAVAAAVTGALVSSLSSTPVSSPLSAFISPPLPATLTASAPLAAGAGAAAWVKAVNTLDSMLGYRSNPIGWAPARLDDVVMWLPARLSALLLAVAAGSPAVPFRPSVRALARRPSSPNSGWPMATMAALLPARLHKPGVYDLDPAVPPSPEGSPTPLPDVATATRAVRITRRAGALAFVAAGVIAWF
ncbi:CobD/CbiB family cobalamin biosynthesis protein [Halobellus rarus]|uniref:Probable cobalamin biosynthesis protein CobD n=1 Tax=Halobellus rarus TaxID=1126237 RepID=A0ABD6CHQ2_9EURY